MQNPPQPMVLTKGMIEKHYNVDNYTIYKQAHGDENVGFENDSLANKVTYLLVLV